MNIHKKIISGIISGLVIVPLAFLCVRCGNVDLNDFFVFGSGGSGFVIFASSDYGSGGVALDSSGRIVVSGYKAIDYRSLEDFYIARYTSAGTLDTSFSGDGEHTQAITAGKPDRGNAVAIQSDGKIVQAGFTGSPSNFGMVRYQTNGSLDTSFGKGGKVSTDFGGINKNDSITSIALQSDGKIVVAGYYHDGTRYAMAIARYLADGKLDLGFGNAGKVKPVVNSGEELLRDVAIDPATGKIVAVGSSSIVLNNELYVVVRLLSNGSLDTSFDGDGTLTTSILADDVAAGVALSSDGKIVAAGYCDDNITHNPQFCAARYLSDGSLDASFDGDGKFIAALGGYDIARDVFIQSDGKIVILGDSAPNSNSNSAFAIIRLNPADGSYDTSFDADGKVLTDLSAVSDRIVAGVIQGDGKIVASGSALARYNANGSLDNQ